MEQEYEPVEEGYFRPLTVEHKLCRDAGLPDEDVFAHSAYSARHEIGESINQTHLIAEGTIPKGDLGEILSRVEVDSMFPQNGDISVFMPYLPFTIEEGNGIHKRPFYELFYKRVADKILGADVFEKEERYQDMAKWIRDRFDKFVAFREDLPFTFGDGEESRRIENLKKQIFMNGDDAHFGINFGKFLDFFGGQFAPKQLHPIIHFGSDVPLYTGEETKSLINRFYNCVEGMNQDNLRSNLDGRCNQERLEEHRKNFPKYCSDSNPQELMSLADTANTLYHNEWSFMFQGAPKNVTIVIPRWTIALEEEFSGNWSGSYHPLLVRGCNATAYNEEAQYVDYIRV